MKENLLQISCKTLISLRLSYLLGHRPLTDLIYAKPDLDFPTIIVEVSGEWRIHWLPV